MEALIITNLTEEVYIPDEEPIIISNNSKLRSKKKSSNQKNEKNERGILTNRSSGSNKLNSKLD